MPFNGRVERRELICDFINQTERYLRIFRDRETTIFKFFLIFSQNTCEFQMFRLYLYHKQLTKKQLKTIIMTTKTFKVGQVSTQISQNFFAWASHVREFKSRKEAEKYADLLWSEILDAADEAGTTLISEKVVTNY